jgi:hypothetical protein
MKFLPISRIALVLSLLGGSALGAEAALANPLVAGNAVGSWRPGSSQHLDWVRAQRAWTDQSYRQTRWRLDQLERCLTRARQPWATDECLRRDQQAQAWQWQRDQQQWQVLMRRFGAPGSSAQRPWQSGLGI